MDSLLNLLSNKKNNNDKNIFVRTPLIESILFRKYCCNRSVFMKMENLQPSGSFKLRGIANLCKYASSNGFNKLVCPSGGNAGLATAYAAMKLQIPCHIIVAQKTPEIILNTIRGYGATVEQYGKEWEEAYHHAIEMTNNSDKIFLVHPFDHPALWQGHSTMIDEIAEDLNNVIPSIIVTCCGGGGLLCGIVQGVRKQGWEKRTKILVMESVGTHSFNLCVQNGGNKTRLEKITSLVSSLAANEVCDQVLQYYCDNQPEILSHLVTDEKTAESCIKFANQYKFLIGLACATSIAAVYTGIVEQIIQKNDKSHEKINENNDGPIIVIVCGGCEISLDHFKKYRQLFNLNNI